jgi:hypothetical protein
MTSFILSHMVSRWLCINSSSLYPLTSIRLVVLNRLILYNCLFDLACLFLTDMDSSVITGSMLISLLSSLLLLVCTTIDLSNELSASWPVWSYTNKMAFSTRSSSRISNPPQIYTPSRNNATSSHTMNYNLNSMKALGKKIEASGCTPSL